jgi:hypothetical protein
LHGGRVLQGDIGKEGHGSQPDSERRGLRMHMKAKEARNTGQRHAITAIFMKIPGMRYDRRLSTKLGRKPILYKVPDRYLRSLIIDRWTA